MTSPSSRKPSLGERLYHDLSRAIVDGQLTPGSNLPPERRLAEARQLNRGAVREAMKRLNQMRLIHTVHGGGNRVNDWRAQCGLELLPELMLGDNGVPNFELLRSVLELRASVGVDAAKLVARRGEPEQVAALQSCLERMAKRPNDLEHLQQEALNFWRLIGLASGNLAYQLTFNSLAAVHERYAPVLRHLQGEELKALKQYQALIDAIRRQDEVKAGQVAGLLVALATEQLGKAEKGHAQRQQTNIDDLFG